MGRVESNYSTKVDPDRLIAEFARAQHGCVSTAQLVQRGVKRSAIRYRQQTGALQAIHRGVLAPGYVPITEVGRLSAALLAAGSDSAVSHRAAACLWGFAPGPAPVEVSSRRSRASVHGVRVHRPRSLEDDVVEHRGLRVTTPARTLVDLCAVLTASHVARLFHEAEVLRLVTRVELREMLERSHGRRGIGKLRRLAHAETPLTRTQLERRFVALVARAGLPAPRTNENLLIAGHWFEFDAHWPDERLAVELDSWQFHRTRERFESDRERDSILAASGWTPLRFTWRRLKDNPHGVIRDLRPHFVSGLGSVQ